MKKTLIALAAVAVSGAAFAQAHNQVTLSGQVGFGVTKTTSGASSLGQTAGHITFAASEDLGGGMTVRVEQGLRFNGRADKMGGKVESRNSTLTIGSASMGRFTVGRVESVANRLSIGASLSSSAGDAIAASAFITSWSYALPTIATGVNLGIAGNLGNGVTTIPTADLLTKDGEINFTAGYTAGPLFADINYRTRDERTRVRASYDLGVAKVSYAAELNYKVGATKKQQEFAVTAPVTAQLTVGLHMASKGTDKGTDFAAIYALSKRTNVNFSLGNHKGSKSDGNSYRVSLNHGF